MMKKRLIACFAVVLTAVSCFGKDNPNAENFLDFTVPNGGEDRSDVKFSDYIGKGKYVLVDFWASWCGPCQREIPIIKDVYEQYAGEDFDVLSVAVWDKRKDTEKAAAEHGIVWSQIYDAQSIPTELYGIKGIPEIMLFGPDGKLLEKGLRGSKIEQTVFKYLKGGK